MSQVITAGAAWAAIMEDPKLAHARRKLSFREFRLIMNHCSVVAATPEEELNDLRAYATLPVDETRQAALYLAQALRQREAKRRQMSNAAPELFEALAACVAVADSPLRRVEASDQHDAAFDRARAVLAKVTGPA